MIIFFILIGLIAFLYALICIGLKLLKNRLIFTPGPDYRSELYPSDINLYFEEIWIENPNTNSSINGWWTPVNPDPEITILYLHGNATSLSDHLEMVQLFHSMGWNSLIIDYPQFGKSKGNFPNEKNLYEDIAKVCNYLIKEKLIKAEKIILHGHSLGGALAIEMAIRFPNLAGVISESSFSSILDMAKKRIYKFFPLNLILDQEFSSIEKIHKLSTPILLMHGKKDTLVPYTMTINLFKKAGSKIKHLVLFEDGRHWNLKIVENDKYIESIKSFISQIR